MSSLHAGDGVDRALEELISEPSFDVTSTSIGAGAQQAQAVLNPPAVVPLEDEAPAAAAPLEVEAPAKTGPTRFRMGSEDPQDRTRGYSPYARTSGPRRQSPARAMPSGFNPVRLPRQEAQPGQLREALRLRAMQSDGPPSAEARASAAAVAQLPPCKAPQHLLGLDLREYSLYCENKLLLKRSVKKPCKGSCGNCSKPLLFNARTRS